MSLFDKIGTCVIACHNNHDYTEIAMTYRENCRSLNNTWSLPGGQFDDNETFLVDSMQRELKEETNLELLSNHIHLIGIQRELIDDSIWLNCVFTGIVKEREALKNCEPHKFREVKWVQFDPYHSPYVGEDAIPLSHISNEALITYYDWYYNNERRIPFKTVTQAIALGL